MGEVIRGEFGDYQPESNEEKGVEKAHRIMEYLDDKKVVIRDLRDQEKIVAKLDIEELADLVLNSNEEEWLKHPEYYSALAERLLTYFG